MKEIKYTIKAVIGIPADQPSGISEINEVMERIREVGEADIVKVELVGTNKGTENEA